MKQSVPFALRIFRIFIASFVVASLFFSVLVLNSLNAFASGGSSNLITPIIRVHQDRLSEDVLPASSFKSSITSEGKMYLLAEEDSDGDGLPDEEEIKLGTNPFRMDSDCDGLLDADEVRVENGVNTIKDSDNDGIVDGMESRHTDSDNDGTRDYLDPDTEYQVVCGKFDPFVITNTETTTFTATAVTPSISRLVMNPGSDDLELYDDGTHGDIKAGDRVFTLAGIGLGHLSSSGYLVITNFGIETQEGLVEVSTRSLFIRDLWIWLVGDEDLVTDTLQTGELFLTQYAAAIVDPELAALVWGGEVFDASRRILDLLGDNFDFIEILPDGGGAHYAAAFYNSLVNQVEGIGIRKFDSRASLGLEPNTARALGILWQNMGGPSLGGATTHELMHQWQAFAGQSLGFGQCVYAHWGILGQGRGVMGGYDPETLVETSPGVFEVDRFNTCCAVGQKYTPLELYFAGLAPPSEVSPIQVPLNVNCGSLKCDSYKCTFNAEGIDTVTIDELIALEGPRIPGFGEAPTHFRIAHVLVTDKAPTNAEMSHIDMKARYIDNPENAVSFSQVSNDRGSTDSTILTNLMNAGMNDAWYNPDTDGQGFFINVFPDLDTASLAWFTYDTELPPDDAQANLGDAGHRWLTAVGPIEGNQVTMDVEMTSGGSFDADAMIQRTDPPGSDGTIKLTLDGCNSGTIEYDIPSINRQGVVPIQRVANDNIALCISLAGLAEVELSNAKRGARSPAVMSIGDPAIAVETQTVTEMNAGLNDAWYNPVTDGQGFFITVFPDLDTASLAWFTYDTELPPDDAQANLGDAGHRWITAVGPIEGNQVTMNIEMTSGGLFDTATLIDRTDPPGSDGTIILTFDSCNSGTVEYDIPSINRQGTVPIRRVADDNIVICEALNSN